MIWPDDAMNDLVDDLADALEVPDEEVGWRTDAGLQFVEVRAADVRRIILGLRLLDIVERGELRPEPDSVAAIRIALERALDALRGEEELLIESGCSDEGLAEVIAACEAALGRSK